MYCVYIKVPDWGIEVFGPYSSQEEAQEHVEKLRRELPHEQWDILGFGKVHRTWKVKEVLSSYD